jgi:stage III sporulation protein AG
MESVRQQVINLIKEYKYVALVLAIGILLMLLPEKQPELTDVPTAKKNTLSQEERLEEILSQIQGVGKVRVLLSIAGGEENIFVFDEDSSGSREVVVITDSQRNQTGLVRQILPPTYLGAVIVCQGGDQASVRLNIAEAVCDATGLSADKITVLKMK